jgi:thiol-disulfide isomerase/thioredoxin
LRIERPGSEYDMMIDSTTHLLRQARSDLTGAQATGGLPTGAHIEMAVVYTRDDPQKEVAASELAWSPPAEAQAYRPAPPVSTGDEPNAASKLEGSPAPAFALNDADNKQVSLSDYKGSVVVLDFWAVWCGPCREALPHLDKLSREKAGAGVKVLAIDEQDAPALAIAYLKQANLGLHLAFDADGTVGKAYMAEAIPETVVIGKDGVVRKVVVGYSAEDDSIGKAVDKALAE